MPKTCLSDIDYECNCCEDPLVTCEKKCIICFRYFMKALDNHDRVQLFPFDGTRE
jgi:hypothetical protein